MQKIEERFLTKVEKTENCWQWKGSPRHSGYGEFWLNGKKVYAHRASFLIFNGSIPDDMVVRHTCDNTNCVNPQHLITGTQLNNIHDAIERGRNVLPPVLRHEKHPRAKIDFEKVSEIRLLYSSGNYSQRKLAAKFGVSQKIINLVVKDKLWVQ